MILVTIIIIIFSSFTSSSLLVFSYSLHFNLTKSASVSFFFNFGACDAAKSFRPSRDLQITVEINKQKPLLPKPYKGAMCSINFTWVNNENLCASWVVEVLRILFYATEVYTLDSILVHGTLGLYTKHPSQWWLEKDINVIQGINVMTLREWESSHNYYCDFTKCCSDANLVSNWFQYCAFKWSSYTLISILVWISLCRCKLNKCACNEKVKSQTSDLPS